MDQELARSLTALTVELGRQIGVLVDRSGRVVHAVVGDAARIHIPDLARSRSARLRGVRLIHTHLYGEPLSEEDLHDLTLLRLDYITAITLDQYGFPALFYSAHVMPGSDPGYVVEAPVYPGQIADNFRDVIRDLEERFRKEEDQLKKGIQRPRAILVGVYTPAMRKRRSPDDSMNELKELCRTAGVECVKAVIQKRNSVDPVTIIGSGKAMDLAIEGVQTRADILIFDMELAPAQAIRLSSITELKIIDRTQLILDIFARNATSRDGKLQVELAQLRYLKGRLMETDDNMSRLTGGIGGRGPGETKLEIGRRRVNDKIRRLEKELKSLTHRRELNRRQRSRQGIPVISIVGYTNAGKSSLLNALTRSEVTAENRLFATLDPTTRRLRFPEEREIILSDTVGFIHDLPPELKRAFQATLEELEDSDLLIHCIDAADPNREQKRADVENILNEMDLMRIPIIHVYNKIDLVPEEDKNLLKAKEGSIIVSATLREGLEELLTSMEHRIFTSTTKRTYSP